MNESFGEVFNCVFSNNQPRAGLVHGGSDIAFTNCTFAKTSGAALDLRRGGIYLYRLTSSTGVLTKEHGKSRPGIKNNFSYRHCCFVFYKCNYRNTWYRITHCSRNFPYNKHFRFMPALHAFPDQYT